MFQIVAMLLININRRLDMIINEKKCVSNVTNVEESNIHTARMGHARKEAFSTIRNRMCRYPSKPRIQMHCNIHGILNNSSGIK